MCIRDSIYIYACIPTSLSAFRIPPQTQSQDPEPSCQESTNNEKTDIERNFLRKVRAGKEVDIQALLMSIR
eukprot:1301637-Amorphochlora_amoeboformis.AAC.1